MKTVAALVAFVGLFAPSVAQQKPAPSPLLTKGAIVTLKLPPAAVAFGGATFASKGIWVVTVNESLPGVYVPNSLPDWRTAGFPILTDFVFEKIGKVKEMTEAEYRNSAVNLKFRIPPHLDAAAVVREFLILGGRSSSETLMYRDEAMRRIADHVFQAELATVSAEQRLALLNLASSSAGTIGVRGVARETYKERAYFAVDLNGDGLMYNTLQLGESQRVARVMNERLFGILKAFGAALKASPDLYGIKLRVEIEHADFLNKLGTLSTDKVDVYAPSDLIRKFAEADITNQDFIDGCIVIVDGNRVKVVLAG